MMIPPIKSKGIFKTLSPFDSILSDKQEYTVVAVRSLAELEQSNENPLEHIYIATGLSEVEYVNDLDNEIPIIVFISTSNDYIYVPANKIASIPEVSGYKYQEKILAINLGAIPVDMYLDSLIDDISGTVKEVTGITVDGKIVDSSAVMMVNDVDHNIFTLKRENGITRTQSFKTLYAREKEVNDRLRTKIGLLECYILENYVFDNEEGLLPAGFPYPLFKGC